MAREESQEKERSGSPKCTVKKPREVGNTSIGMSSHAQPEVFNSRREVCPARERHTRELGELSRP